MKLSSILAAALMTASATASGAGLAPFQYSVGQRPMTAPLQEISVDFHTEVEGEHGVVEQVALHCHILCFHRH